MKHYLGIDIGTFESKGVVVDETGRIVAQAAQSHRMLVPQPGWAEHNPEEDWWGDFKRLSQELISASGLSPASIRSVGVSAIGPCMLPVDHEGLPLMNGILYGVDTRAAKEIQTLTDEFGNAAILEATGNALTSQSVGPKILWLKNNRPDIYRSAAKFITSTTFIVQRLTGRYVIDHYSAASWAPLYSPSEGGWSSRFAGDITTQDRLAGIEWTTGTVGEVTPNAAKATGLSAGTPVIVGTIDAASEAVSAGVLDPGEMMLMYGSTVFVIRVTAYRVSDNRLWYAPWLFPGTHASMAGLATSGTLTHWFRDQFGREFSDAKAAAITLASEAAQSPKGANGLVLLPYFSGERTPYHDPGAKGMMFGMDLTHTRADIYRALLEGIAHATRDIIDLYAETGQTPSKIEAVGGGVNNPVWLQATSDICGIRQNIRTHTTGAAYGNAFLAALGAGDVPRSAIRDWNVAAREVEPDPQAREMYARHHSRFRELYARTKDLMHATSA
jgi:xylulokinase